MLVTQETHRTKPRQLRLQRGLAVLSAIIAALAVWLVAKFGLGVEVAEPESSGPASQIDTANIVVVSAAALFAGWALLAVLERFTARAARWWLRIAVLVAIVSLAGPLTTPGLTASGRVVLGMLHLVIGTLAIALLYRSSPTRGADSP